MRRNGRFDVDVYLVSRLPARLVPDHISALERLGGLTLGSHYTLRVAETISRGDLTTVIALGRNAHNPAPELYLRGDGLSVVFSGYLADEVDSRSLPAIFGRQRGDVRPVRSSPGGIYSYVSVRRDDGQIFAAQSRPSLEPAYYQRTEESVHVGNHPFLVHMASTGGDRPRVDERHFFSAISASVALDDTTPFLGCYRVPPQHGLRGNPTTLDVEVVPVSAPSAPRHRLRTVEQRTDALVAELGRAFAPLHRLPTGELRLSGGKDSRLLAAYLARSGTQVVPINQNFPQEVEGQVADRIAQVLGHESSTRVPVGSTLSRPDLIAATQRKVAFSAGLPQVAAMQYPTRVEGSRPGVPLLLGHAHLQRGGLGARIRSVADVVGAIAGRAVSPLLLPEYSEPNLHWVRGFVAQALRESRNVARTVTYLAYIALPLDYQFGSSYTYTRNWNALITPMVDERFAATCTAIAQTPASRLPHRSRAGILDLATEELAFRATGELAPELLRIPLSGDRFRCDYPAREGHDLRDPDQLTPGQVPQAEVEKIFNTRMMSQSLRGELWDVIRETPVADMVRAVATPEMVTFVTEPRTEPSDTYSRSQRSQFAWTVFGLATILGTDWWSALSRAE